MLNREEYVADTDPNDEESLLAVTGEWSDPETFVLTWNSSTTRVYHVERCDDLTNMTFSVIATNQELVLPQNVYTDAVGAVTAYFYRVGVDWP